METCQSHSESPGTLTRVAWVGRIGTCSPPVCFQHALAQWFPNTGGQKSSGGLVKLASLPRKLSRFWYWNLLKRRMETKVLLSPVSAYLWMCTNKGRKERRRGGAGGRKRRKEKRKEVFPGGPGAKTPCSRCNRPRSCMPQRRPGAAREINKYC